MLSFNNESLLKESKLMKIQELTVSERIMLAEKLWDSVLDEESDLKLTKNQELELEKRLNAFLSDQNMGASWSEVKTRIISENK